MSAASQTATYTPESVRSLSPAHLMAFRDRVICGRNGVLAIFGAVQAEEVRRLAEEALGGLPPGAAAFTSLPQPATLVDSAEVVHSVPPSSRVPKGR